MDEQVKEARYKKLHCIILLMIFKKSIATQGSVVAAKGWEEGRVGSDG